MCDISQLQKNWHFHLKAFLDKSDDNYIAGRALWHLWSYDSAGNLLWLSIEQISKIIITQQEIIAAKFIQQSELNQLKNKKNTTKQFCQIISNIFKRINGIHSVKGLIDNSIPVLKNALEKEKRLLDTLNELYISRYYIPKNRTTYGSLIHEIDRLYFTLRGMLSEQIPVAQIDEILFDIEFGEPLILPYQKELTKNNKYLSNRKYPRLNKILTGEIVSFDGVTKETSTK